MKKILFVVGTRPEAIKMDPVIRACSSHFEVTVCLTNQHPEIRRLISAPDESVFCLGMSREGERGIAGLSGKILQAMDNDERMRKCAPDVVAVHGDTTSSLCGAMYAFYEKIPLCHVEAGLRTNDKNSPFPEESNRRTIDYLSSFNFAPTELARKNLCEEGLEAGCHVVGNSIVDVMKSRKKPSVPRRISEWIKGKRFGLATIHRRENWDMLGYYLSDLSLFCSRESCHVLYVKHMNRRLCEEADRRLSSNPYILSVDALDSGVFQELVSSCDFVLTDSGGVQEEAVFFEKPLLVMRASTERQEIIEEGCGTLVSGSLVESLENLVKGRMKFNRNKHLYGDGNTGKKISGILAGLLY